MSSGDQFECCTVRKHVIKMLAWLSWIYIGS